MKNARLICAVLAVAACTATGHAEHPHSPPPPGDPYLTNRLGRSWCEPIYTGYLIADGRYIDAPYIVEQRGYKTMVNGVQVGRVDPRCVLPLPEPEAVTEDPGMPRDLTQDTSLGEALRHPVTVAKLRYWDHIGLKGQARLEAEMECFRSFPCVADVEDTGEEGYNANTRIVRLTDQAGVSKLRAVRLTPRDPKPPPPDETVHKWTVTAMNRIERKLGRGRLLLVRYGGIAAEKGLPDDLPVALELFETMAGDLPAEEKLAKLKALGFVSRGKDLEMAEGFYPITYFQPTDQLWQRLKDDPSWKNDAEERLFALTNGWRRIAPAFERESAPSPVQKDVAAQRVDAVAEELATDSPSIAGEAPAVETTGAVGSVGNEDEQRSAPSTPSRHGLPATLAMAAVLGIAAVAALFLIRRG